MNTRYLKKLKYKRIFSKYHKYIYLGILCFICLIAEIYFTYSKFSVTKEDEVVKTTVGNFIYGDVVIGAYINGEYFKSIPSKNDGYVVDKIICDNDTQATWNYESWSLNTANLSKRSKCNIYFKNSNASKIIKEVDTTGKCPSVNSDGSIDITTIEQTNSYICSAPDAYGTSYYYRGNVTNNYVKFAGFYWRIIRINGDGTVRVIYDGTSAHKNGESSTDRHIGTSLFSSFGKDNAYVGYMYGAAGASSYTEAHKNSNNSAIKIYIDNWYKNNILNTKYEEYIVDNIFCNDRSLASNHSSDYPNTGYSTDNTAYRWFYLGNSSYNNKKMFLTCPQKSDAFTVDNTVHGNGDLKYPIGLISTDEGFLAGGGGQDTLGTADTNFYLYTGYEYWSMTPNRLEKNSNSMINIINNMGYTSYGQNVETTSYVKPVINLTPNVLELGDGTASNPYRLSE